MYLPLIKTMIATSTHGYARGTSACGVRVRVLKDKGHRLENHVNIFHIRATKETTLSNLTTQNPTVRASYIAVLHTATIDLYHLPPTLRLLPCVGAVNTGAITRTVTAAQLFVIVIVVGRCVPVKDALHAGPSTPLEASPAGLGIP